MKLHGCGLGGEIVKHLIVTEPWNPELAYPMDNDTINWESQLTVQRRPEENGTGFQSTSDFLHPGVVKSHPARLIRNFTRLGLVPHIGSAEIAVTAPGIRQTKVRVQEKRTRFAGNGLRFNWIY
jgi:hypothetical protein